MKQTIKKALRHSNKNKYINNLVKHSLKKYKKTYDLLEEYDQKSIQNPEALADPGRMRQYIQNLQKICGI